MSTSAQRSSFDRLTADYAFRSITTFIQVIERKSGSRTSSEPEFFFTNDTTDDLTSTERQQFRINTALSVCAIRKSEVIAVLSSREKTAGVSNGFVVTVNPKCPTIKDCKHLLPQDVLVYQTTDSDDAMPRLVSGKADKMLFINSTNFFKNRLWV